MKTTIWKYELTPNGKIEMPFGAKVLSVGTQSGEIFVWAWVDPNETRMVVKEFFTTATGHEFEWGNFKFIGTVQLGSLVFHVFEVLS